jgi:hypothetical protein
MSQYIYNVFVPVVECTECNAERQLVLSTGKKWVATQYLEGVLQEGGSLMNYDISRSIDGRPDTAVWIDSYEFMKIDLGEMS